MGMTVICFHNNNEENGYLSNWYPSTFTHNGILFLNGAVYDVPKGTFLWR